MVKGNLMMVKRLGKVTSDELGLETWLPPMGPFPLVNEVGIILECKTLKFSLRKGRHAEHLQLYLMRKVQKDWADICGAGSLGMVDTIYKRNGRILTATAYPTRGPWFGIFMRGYKFRMGVIKKQDFGITCKVVKDIPERWE